MVLRTMLLRARQVTGLIGQAAPPTDTSENRSRERYRRIGLTTLSSVGNRALTILVSFVSVPLALGYLGEERYGVWLTINSTIAWLSFTNLGLGPSLINNLAATKGDERQAEAQKLVATAWWVQLGIAAILLLAFALISPWVSWGALFNVSSPTIADEVGVAVAVVWLAFALQIPLSTTANVYIALQEGYLASLWQLLASPLKLVALLVVVQMDGGIALLALALLVVPMLVSIASTIYLFGWHKPWLQPHPALVSRQAAGSLIHLGSHFIGYSLAGIIITSTDNFVITQTLGPALVPPFAVTFMLTQIIISFQMMWLDAAWPAYTEATIRGDITWLRRTHQHITRLSVLVVGLVSAALCVVGRPFIAWWSGPAAVPTLPLLLTLALLTFVQSYFLCYGRLLTALGAVRLNMWAGMANAAINLIFSLLLVQWLGLAGVALGTLVGYVATGWVLVVATHRELQQLERTTHTVQPPPPTPSIV